MNRPHPLHVATFAAFLGLLMMPWVAGLFGASAQTVERRSPSPLPEIGATELLQSETFTMLNSYVRDRTPLRGSATQLYNRAWLNLADVSPKTSVVEGPGSTLFLGEDFTEPCKRNYDPADMIDMFGRWSDAANESGKEWKFLVAPDKGAVLSHRLDGRAALASQCGNEVRQDFHNELAQTEAVIEVASALRDADIAEPGLWYYENDSHWTFDAGSLVSGLIVDQFQPNTWDPASVGPTGQTLGIQDDIYARLGFDRSMAEPVPVLGSLRPDVDTLLTETSIDGTRTIRTYTNSGSGSLVPGTTIIVHDSMMNFVESQLAPYFERVIFIHWFDIAKANFFARVVTADRILLTRVERNVHLTIESTLMGSFDERFDAALRAVADETLASELDEGALALQRFTTDTGRFAQAYHELLVDPGVDGWAGPYLDGAIFSTGFHPRYGEWKTLQIDEVPEGTPADCREFHDGPCGTWLLILNVPEETILQLDQEFDDGDGLEVGRVRRSLPHGILYFYSMA